MKLKKRVSFTFHDVFIFCRAWKSQSFEQVGEQLFSKRSHFCRCDTENTETPLMCLFITDICFIIAKFAHQRLRQYFYVQLMILQSLYISTKYVFF